MHRIISQSARLLAIVVLSHSPQFSHAQEPIPPGIDPCGPTLDGQTRLDACRQQQYQTADQALNQIYKAVTTNLPASFKTQLVAAQRAWLAFRDADCDAWAAQQSAALQNSGRSACLTKLTDARTATLKAAYQDRPPSIRSQGNQATADAALNRQYKQIIAGLDKASSARLRQAQRLWLPFRDADCAAQSAYGVAPDTCLAAHTEARLGTLQAGYTTLAAGPGVLVASALVGTWQGQGGESVLEMRFGIEGGIHHYYASLEKLPFEAGQWQLQRDELTITNSEGKVIHAYQRVTLTDGLLSLREPDGALLQYRKVSDSAALP